MTAKTLNTKTCLCWLNKSTSIIALSDTQLLSEGAFLRPALDMATLFEQY